MEKTGLKRNRSFLDWRDELFETSLTGQSYFSHYFMEKIQNLSDISIDYVQNSTSEISSDQESLIQLDVATKKALDLIKGKGKDMADVFKKKPEVIDFSLKIKNYITQLKNYKMADLHETFVSFNDNIKLSEKKREKRTKNI